jgi:hypothetical protein
MASLKGNYQGLFAPEDGYLGPNGTADFDSPNVSINRYGALKGDVRNTIKLMGAKDWQIARGHGVGTGLSFRARSGVPTSYLGADPFTYPTESYLAARGAGPRLPWLFTADLQLAYRVAAVYGVGLSVTADVFNLFNWQRHVAVDEEFTTDNVIATEGFSAATLAATPAGQPVQGLQNDAGGAVTRKDGFGDPTAYQEPRVFRFGIRGEF